MTNVKSVVENQTVVITLETEGGSYEAQFSFPSDDPKKAILTICQGGVLQSFPAVVAQAAIQAFAETKVEFAS